MGYTEHRRISVLMLLQAIPPLQSGGAEIQALRLGSELQSKDIHVEYICPGTLKVRGTSSYNGLITHRLHSIINLPLDFLFFIQKKKGKPKVAIEYDDSKSSNQTITRKIGIGARLRYLIFIWNAKRFLQKRRGDFDLIHVHTIEWPSYAGTLLARRTGLRLLVKDSTMNGLVNLLRYPDGGKKKQMLIETADFVAMTKVIHKNLQAAGVPFNKIHPIPNGIQITPGQKRNYSQNDSVLFVGNLYQQPAKGIDILLRCWPQVIAAFPNAKLNVAGDGDLDEYRQYATRLDIEHSVSFLGKTSNVQQMLLDADLFVLPSRREGMPNSLMEAMLCALPCVATDISGCQDLIQHEHNGLLVPAADTDALAMAIIRLLRNRDEAAKYGKHARETIVAQYDIAVVASRYQALYKQLISK
jgi:glycosyltransferase involved in cell wall biosynthesis